MYDNEECLELYLEYQEQLKNVAKESKEEAEEND